MHMVDRLKELVDEVLDSGFRDVVASSFDRLVHIHVHKFKHQGQSSCGLVTNIKSELLEHFQ